jgi:hypothetical protein
MKGDRKFFRIQWSQNGGRDEDILLVTGDPQEAPSWVKAVSGGEAVDPGNAQSVPMLLLKLWGWWGTISHWHVDQWDVNKEWMNAHLSQIYQNQQFLVTSTFKMEMEWIFKTWLLTQQCCVICQERFSAQQTFMYTGMKWAAVCYQLIIPHQEII